MRLVAGCDRLCRSVGEENVWGGLGATAICIVLMVCMAN